MKTITKFVLFCFLCLTITGHLSAQIITQDQAMEYVRSTWDVVGLSDETLRATLDMSDSAETSTASYLGWVDFFVKAPLFLDPLARGDYSTALQNAMGYAEDQAFGQLISVAGLDAVAAPAEFVATTLTLGFDVYAALLREDAFYYQRNLYFLARKAGNSAQAIRDLRDGDLLNNVPSRGRDRSHTTGGQLTDITKGRLWLCSTAATTAQIQHRKNGVRPRAAGLPYPP